MIVVKARPVATKRNSGEVTPQIFKGPPHFVAPRNIYIKHKIKTKTFP